VVYTTSGTTLKAKNVDLDDDNASKLYRKSMALNSGSSVPRLWYIPEVGPLLVQPALQASWALQLGRIAAARALASLQRAHDDLSLHT
jgi:hypothetical protein